jgi:hypothetical protein
MPLTQAQARDRFIMNSIIQFLDRNVKATVATQKYPTPLTLKPAKPDNTSVVLQAPVIAVSEIGSGEKDRAYGLGQSTVWRHRSFLFSCYPSLDANGEPCDLAHDDLRTLVQNALETENIKIVDYANSSPGNLVFCDDLFYIVGVSDPIDRGATTALAQEKHRFDVHLTVKYTVTASLAT